MKAVNLLPQDLRSAERRGPGAARRESAGSLAIIGVLALVLVAVVATVLAQNRIKSNERELRTVEADQVVAQREADSLASYGRFQELAAKRVGTVRQLAAARFDWERALRDLSRAIPRDVTLDLISGTVAANSNSAGASPNPLRASIAAPAIELSGCTAGQLEVARLMARLRGVQGVTRVSLASSVKDESDASTTPTPSSSGAVSALEKPAGCGLGSKPKFQIVIFFESATAPPAGAAATPATPAAPGTPATPAATPAPGQTTAAATPTPAAGTAAPAATPAPGEQTPATSSSAPKEVSAP